MFRLSCAILLSVTVAIHAFFVIQEAPTDVIEETGFDDDQNYIQSNPLYRHDTGYVSLSLNPFFRFLNIAKDEHPNISAFTQNSYKKNNEKRDRYYRTGSKEGEPTKREFMFSPNQFWNERKTPISRHQMRQFPYANIVQLSCGCTGTLLTPHHVITAAHCVHDRIGFKENIEMLKVHVPDKYGYRVHYVKKINVPVMWMKSQMIPEYAYDYAVLQLNLPVIGREKFMQLALPTVKTKYSDLHFFGFFPEESNGMWESTCSAEKSRFIYGGNAVLTECETTAGNSGAAVFAEDAIDGDQIIGLMSSSINIYNDKEMDAIMLLTLSKCLDICAMIYPEGEKYDVCLQVKRYDTRYLQVGSNRIMPFFG